MKFDNNEIDKSEPADLFSNKKLDRRLQIFKITFYISFCLYTKTIKSNKDVKMIIKFNFVIIIFTN